MDWPLPLWRVLREELAHLQGKALSPEASNATAEQFLFCAKDITDLSLLVEEIERRKPDLNMVLPSADFAEEFRKIDAIAASPSPETAEAKCDVVRFLNRLLKIPMLWKAFPTIAESRDVKEQKPTAQKPLELDELNRYLLDVAFAGSVRPLSDKLLPTVIEDLHKESLSALCFSGGGIRSATFCLGVVQGLARKYPVAGCPASCEPVLGKFSYLSTVSGGGYLGGWLAAWTYWSDRGLPEVIEQLTNSKPSKLEPEPDPVFYLRNFSNYLSPLTGLLSADTWTLAAIYIRNLLLNWVVLLPLLIAILAVPRLVLVLFHPAHPLQVLMGSDWWLDAQRFCLLVAVLGFACAMFYQGMVRPSHFKQLKCRSGSSRWSRWWLHHRGQDGFLKLCLLPLVVSAFIFSSYTYHAYLFQGGGSGKLYDFLEFGAVAALLGWAAYATSLRRRYIGDLFAMLLSALAGVGLFYLIFMNWTWFDVQMRNNRELYLCLASPLVLVVFLLAATIFVGIATFWTDDEDREYWARMGGWVLIASIAWTALSAISLFGPHLFIRQSWWGKALSCGGSMIVSAVTAYFGFSAKTPARTNSESAQPPSALLQRGLPILGAISIVLILAALAVAAQRLVSATTDLIVSAATVTGSASESNMLWSISHWLSEHHAVSISGALFAIVVSALLGFGMSDVIDPNKYSLHAMYRNRLVRAYLGASRKKGVRHPNPFTGLDPDDNIQMSLLWQEKQGSPRKLMPFINMTLNMVEPVSTKLAWQERKAETFTVTPLHAGSFWVGYRRSQDYARGTLKPRAGKMAITLGTATAISGAAVSPDMGYNSSPIVSMLLTLFNARLGWWLGNPGTAGNDTYWYSGPGKGPEYLMDEALGRTNDVKPYVYLSDGGHFENLGLYEMVLRRCRTIVVIDAGEDREFTFEDLGNAIRKIRIDLGISIEFPNFSNFRKLNDGGSTLYCSVGNIRYKPEDHDADGKLIYIKPTIRGDESADVLNYERQHTDFPHESTADQWFSESQFESYRALGEYEIRQILTEDEESGTYAAVRTILGELK
jgi:hypothetical protein